MQTHTPTPTCPAPAEPRAAFTGWYDSSFDLQRGLVVTEHAGFDPLADVCLPPLAWAPASPGRWSAPSEGAPR